MKHINMAKNSSDIQIVFEVGTEELVRETLTAVVLARLPSYYHDKVFFADFVNYDKFGKVPALPNVKLVVSPDIGWATHLPHIHYRYDSKALFLAIELEKLEKAIIKLLHFLEHGAFPVTQVPRKGFYPTNSDEVKKVFAYLHKYPVLGADIEATSLKFYKAKLVSISFAINESKGVTFHVKRCSFLAELKEFFETYKGRIVWHNGAYDVKVLAFLLFNSDSRVLYRTFEDTKFLHYMCTNSPERPSRALGDLAVELCGSYKLTKAEITNMMNVNVEKVCRYNLDDSRATWWLYSIYRTKIYSEYFYEKMKRWQWALTQMELTGVPYLVKDLKAATSLVETKLKDITHQLNTFSLIEKTLDLVQKYEMEKYNATHVGDKEIWEIPRKVFNPNSPKHMKLLFESVLGIESPLSTPKGNPSYGVKAFPHLRLLVENNPSAMDLMEALQEYSGYSQLYSTFLKPMLDNSWVKEDGTATLHGSYNLGLVVSGRLSSSEPNLQNLPSKGDLGKIFKSIITAPKGKIMGASDYASLEERVNTILTKDPNKRKIYIDGYDGHSYRAYYYFPDQLKHITEKLANATASEHKAIINSIKETDGNLRDDSKPATFLLQYLGTAYGLRLNCGFTADKALAIERNYHDLYKISDDWLQAKLGEAADKGYAEVAFGLRVHCTAISKSILNSKYTPKIVQKHIRTIGNAIGGQSYGQITVDAGMKFLERVYAQGLEHRVQLSMTIHDALYPIWDDCPELTKWVNDNLIECMEDLSELPELKGDIPIISDLEYFSPSWAKCKPLPKFGSLEQIKEALQA